MVAAGRIRILQVLSAGRARASVPGVLRSLRSLCAVETFIILGCLAAGSGGAARTGSQPVKMTASKTKIFFDIVAP